MRGAFHRLQKQKASVSSARYFVGGGGRGAGGMRGALNSTPNHGAARDRITPKHAGYTTKVALCGSSAPGICLSTFSTSI